MHVIWDWNGTLLDDFTAILASVNHVLKRFGHDGIGPDQYRDQYTRPVQGFYERLLGCALTERDWGSISRTFYAAYRERARAAPLASDAQTALAHVGATGGTQSVLSMLPHRNLMDAMEAHGLANHMLRIDGVRDADGGAKSTYLTAHLRRILVARRGLGRDRLLVVGDSLDDAAAAKHADVACVLVDSGTHHRADLERVGVPVADSLLHALELASDSR